MNDLDIWMNAIKKIDLTEAVSPIYKGHLLLEDTQVEFYNKIQKLLNTNGMEDSHAWLYDLDPTELTECECDKINRLYSLAQDRGLIDQDPVEEPEVEEEPKIVEQPAPQIPVQRPIKQAAFTVIYSATRDGSIKTGEAYSNAINTRSAKADIINKLERAGYQNVSILAIEASDPDMQGCDNTYIKQSDYQVPDYSVEEADDREPLGHALDSVGIKASTANLRRNNAVETSYISDAEDDSVGSQVFNGKPLTQWEKLFKGEFTIPQLYRIATTGTDLNKLLLNINGVSSLEDSDQEVEENDMLNNRIHNGHIDEADDKKEPDEEKDDTAEDNDKDDKEADEEKTDTSDAKDDSGDANDEEDQKTADKKEEKTEEPDETLKDDTKAEDAKNPDSEDGKELSAAEKESLKDAYKKAFKAALEKGKYDVSFSELNLDQKIKFFTDLNKSWSGKADPSEFMDEKSQEQLEKIKIKK